MNIIVGFAVGVVDKSKILDNKTIKEGDAVILEKSSLQTNVSRPMRMRIPR